jgi:hypothetical protein
MVKNNSNVPEGVLILAVFAFLGALSFFILGAQMLFVSDSLRGTLGLPLMDPATKVVSGYITSGVFLMMALSFLVISILAYHLGRGLLRLKLWTKIVFGIIAVLGIFFSLFALSRSLYLSGVFGLIVSGLVLWYLFVRESSKKIFK